jgi:hypothetical protein
VGDSYALTYLGYSQTIGQKPTQRFLELKMRNLPQIATVRLMTALGAIYYNSQASDGRTQAALLRELSGRGYWVDRGCALLERGGWVLFHDELFAGMAKLALRLSPSDERDVPSGFGANIAQCALMYNELLGEEILRKGEADPKLGTLAAELRGLPRDRDHRYAIAGRYAAFVQWMRSEEPSKRGWSRLIDDDFVRFYGLTIDDYLDACALFGTIYSAMRDVASLTTFDPIIAKPRWFQNVREPAFIDRFVSAFSIPAAELVRQWDAATNTSLSLAALGSLWKRPFVRLDETHVVAPLPPLIYNAMGEGLYYALFDQYDSKNKAVILVLFR